MGIRNRAEAIILQSVEDLYDKRQERDCLTFFRGEGFDISAGLAGLNVKDQRKLLELIKCSMQQWNMLVKDVKRRMNLEYSVSRGR